MARSSRGTAAALVVVLGALALSACDTRPQKNGADIPTTTTFQFSAPELRVHVRDRGDLTLEQGTAATVDVTRYRTGGAADRANRLAMENADLWLDDGCPESSRGICDNRYVVKVPPQVNLVVEIGAGDVRVSGVTSRLELKADRGDVRGDRVTGDLKITARDGDVSLGELRSGRVETIAEHGDVRVDFAAAPTTVDLQVARGDVRLTLPTGAERYRLDVRPERGELHSGIDNDAASDRTVRVVAGVGDISLGRS
ncbi:DUF4097 family beta strand repeat-containing protein [Allokutzneria oryzae]|uniref:DUF4097 family beta strand repeat-containing protein n=1 Tax=Allokutzneria oryzae TaxID=1378989 RepID=A0ABV6A2B0_9PSEU